MMLDPVSVNDIAKRSGARPSTAEQWTQDNTFPQPDGNRLWEWRAAEKWLIATGRLPGALRYRSTDGHRSVQVESSQPRANGGTRWVKLATFVQGHEDTWSPIPAPALFEMTDTPREAAARLLQGWETARMEWARDHPDEEMPAHLVGSPWPARLDLPEGAGEPPAAEPVPDPIRDAKARLAAQWALGKLDDQTYRDAMDHLDAETAS